VSRGLGELELEIADAILARLIPSDENGPGAREAQVVQYVARLAAEDSGVRDAYARGLAAVGERFVELAPDEQDAVLDELARSSSAFFELIRRHALEGMFGDPSWGGNAGRVGWELLGYPGPRHEWTEADQQIEDA
jgi:gluconate 2-dehydrogenase gamma chain